eukprot:873900-Pleurochrysis_carterae.AAC.1
MYSLRIDVNDEAVGGTRDFATGASALRDLSPGTPAYPGWASYANFPSPAKSWHGQISPGARQAGLTRSGSAASVVRAARSKKDLRFAASNNALEVQLSDTTSVANAVSQVLEMVNIETSELQLLEQHTSKALSLKEIAMEAASSKWLAPRVSEQPEQLCELKLRRLPHVQLSKHVSSAVSHDFYVQHSKNAVTPALFVFLMRTVSWPFRYTEDAALLECQNISSPAICGAEVLHVCDLSTARLGVRSDAAFLASRPWCAGGRPVP